MSGGDGAVPAPLAPSQTSSLRRSSQELLSIEVAAVAYCFQKAGKPRAAFLEFHNHLLLVLEPAEVVGI